METKKENKQNQENREEKRVITRREAEEAMKLYARLMSRMDKLQATIDEKVQQVHDRYGDELLTLAEESEEALAIVERWAEENRDEICTAGRRSLELQGGTIGYRTGKPKLQTMQGFTWDSALTMLRMLRPEYVRTTEAVDKARLLTDRQADGMGDLLKSVGLCVAQDEVFYVVPNN